MNLIKPKLNFFVLNFNLWENKSSASLHSECRVVSKGGWAYYRNNWKYFTSAFFLFFPSILHFYRGTCIHLYALFHVYFSFSMASFFFIFPHFFLEEGQTQACVWVGRQAGTQMWLGGVGKKKVHDPVCILFFHHILSQPCSHNWPHVIRWHIFIWVPLADNLRGELHRQPC